MLSWMGSPPICTRWGDTRGPPARPPTPKQTSSRGCPPPRATTAALEMAQVRRRLPGALREALRLKVAVTFGDCDVSTATAAGHRFFGPRPAGRGGGGKAAMAGKAQRHGVSFR